MKFSSGDAIFKDLRDAVFVSRFPSEDTIASQRFAALLNENTAFPSYKQFARWAAESFVLALQLAAEKRAIFAGDLLRTQVEKIYKLQPGGAVWGLFASVDLSNDPQQFSRKLDEAGFSIALTAISQVPVYGTIIAGALSAGKQAALAFNDWYISKKSPNYLPWSEYSKDVDEAFVQSFLENEGQGVDYTRVWMPSFHVEPWKFGWRNNKRDGIVFGPYEGQGKLAFSAGFGCVPASARVIGNTQAMLAPVPPSSPELARYAFTGQGYKRVQIPWNLQVTQTGDYLPSLGQLGMGLWFQAEAGGPMMFRIHAQALIDAWQQFSANLYETGFDSLLRVSQQLKAGGGGMPQPYLQVFASQLLEPYIVVGRRPMPWAGTGPDGAAAPFALELGGGFPVGPRPSPIVHPGIFDEGPVAPWQRAVSAWFEEDAKRTRWAWPHNSPPNPLPRQAAPAYSPIWKGHGSIDGGVLTGLPKKPPEDGLRRVPWPNLETAASFYGRIYEHLIGPRLLAFRAAQQRTLRRVFEPDVVDGGAIDENVLVSAYLRPDPVGSLPAYGAFADTNLRNLARGARDRLVELVKAGHPAREYISLEDVGPIDEAFRAKLVAAGATGAKAGQPMPAPPAHPEGPQGGVPFEGDGPPDQAGGGGGLLAALGALGVLGAAGTAAYFATRPRPTAPPPKGRNRRVQSR